MHDPEQIHYQDTALWTVGNQVEATIASGLRDDLHLTGGHQIALTPTLEDMAFQFAATTDAADDRANTRTLKGTDTAQVTIRFPAVLAAATGLLDHARNRSSPRLDFSRTENEATRFTMCPLPPLRPDIPADAGQTLDVAPAEKHLLELPTAYAAELDTRFATTLGLIAGDPVAWTLSVRDGRLALVGDFDRARIPSEDAPNVRKVQTHQSGVADALSEQYRVYIPKALIDALYWEDLKLRLQLEHQRLVIQPALDTTDLGDLDADVPLDTLPGAPFDSTPA